MESKPISRRRIRENLKNLNEGNGFASFGFENPKTFPKLYSDVFIPIPSQYNHRIFRKAGLLFDTLVSKGTNLLDKHTAKNIKIKFRTDEERRKTLELTQSVLPYQSILEKVLTKIKFFSSNRSFEKERGIVMVMLYDYLQRHFQPVPPQNEKDAHGVTSQISNALYLKKTAINAELARERIAKDARSVEELIQPSISRCVDILPSQPQYAWVNNFKTNMPALLKELGKQGFVHVINPKDLCSIGFCQDSDCSDLLVFHPDWRYKLMKFFLVEMSHLIIQHKSSCLGAYLSSTLIPKIEPDTSEGNNKLQVLVTHTGEGWTPLHLASLVGNNVTVLACNPSSDFLQVERRIAESGANNVKIIPRPFLECTPNDPDFSQVVVILVNPRSSNSGISDPVDFILREGGDIQLLKEVVGLSVKQNFNVDNFQVEQRKFLRHALKFPNVRHVVYNTHSINKEENDDVIESVLEEINEEYREIQKKLDTTNLIKLERPPKNQFLVEPLDIYHRLGTDKDSPLYLNIKPNQWMEGCFVGVIKRQDILKVSAKDIVDQAKAKGILSDLQATGCSTKKIQTDVFCGRCDRRNARSRRRTRGNGPPPFKLGGCLNHGTFPAPPETIPAPTKLPIRPITWSPPSNPRTPFPIFKPKSNRKRNPYPLATKTLHLPGAAPPTYYRKILNIQSDGKYLKF